MASRSEYDVVRSLTPAIEAYLEDVEVDEDDERLETTNPSTTIDVHDDDVRDDDDARALKFPNDTIDHARLRATLASDDIASRVDVCRSDIGASSRHKSTSYLCAARWTSAETRAHENNNVVHERCSRGVRAIGARARGELGAASVRGFRFCASAVDA